MEKMTEKLRGYVQLCPNYQRVLVRLCLTLVAPQQFIYLCQDTNQLLLH